MCVCVVYGVWSDKAHVARVGGGIARVLAISRGPDGQCVVTVGVGMAGYLLLQPPSLQHVVGDWHGIGLLVGISYKLSDFSGWNSINA